MNILDRVIDSLQQEKVPYAIVGGFAVALHGAPRGTMDLDCIIEHTESSFTACERALKGIGLVPRLPVTVQEVFQFREEYIQRRNLIAWSFYNPTQQLEVVNIIITHDLRTLRTVAKNYGVKKLRILSLADLINMKRASGRPQDLEDIKMLEKLDERTQEDYSK